MADGIVLSLQVKPRRGHMEFRPSVSAQAGGGLEGDMYRDQPTRKVLLLSKETLDECGLRPGDLREQITVDLPGLQRLPAGATLRIGKARLRIEGDCAPCAHMASIHGVADPAAWVEAMRGKRGMFAFVIAPGRIAVGDAIVVEGRDPQNE